MKFLNGSDPASSGAGAGFAVYYFDISAEQTFMELGCRALEVDNSMHRARGPSQARLSQLLSDVLKQQAQRRGCPQS